jgi:hypothetical protein
MLEQYFLRPTTVDRIRSNWLGPQIERYVEWMHVQKYAQRNITRRVALLCHFADFAKTNGATDLASAGPRSALLPPNASSEWRPSLPMCSASVASSCVRSVILTDERCLHFQLRQDKHAFPET